jgi:hypothetical protein
MPAPIPFSPASISAFTLPQLRFRDSSAHFSATPLWRLIGAPLILMQVRQTSADRLIPRARYLP